MDMFLSNADPESRRVTKWRVRLVMLIIFTAAYVSAPIVFITVYANYEAAGGFMVVVILISLRLVIHLQPKEVLWRVFPPMSWSRGLYQGFFFLGGIAGIGLALWQLAEGLLKHQKWTGSSHFCGMIGMIMGGRWCFNVTAPIYYLRADRLTPEELKRVMEIDGSVDYPNESVDSDCSAGATKATAFGESYASGSRSGSVADDGSPLHP